MSEHIWTAEEDAEFRSLTDGAPPAMNGAAPAPERGLALLSVADLAALPAPEWLLDSILPAGGFSVLYGPSGAGKSFIALDWSLCVATGLAWYGKDTQQGWVLYIAAEGVAGLYRRIDAWLHHRNSTSPTRSASCPPRSTCSRPATSTSSRSPSPPCRARRHSSSSTPWPAP